MSTRVEFKSVQHIELPWESATTPHAKAVFERITDIVFKCGLLKDITARKRFHGVVHLAEFFYPDCNESGLLFGSALVAWLYFFDDIFDEEDQNIKWEECVRTVDRMSHLMQTGLLPTQHANTELTPVEKLGLQVRQMASAMCQGRPNVLARFIEDCRIYIEDGILPFSELQRKGTVPTLEQYLPLRVLNGAGDTVVSGHEIVSNLRLPKDIVVNDARVSRMRYITSLVIDFSNDMYSYQREVIVHKKVVNSLYIRQRGAPSFEHAADEQVREINGWVEEYLELKRQLADDDLLANGSELACYCTGMENLMLGAKKWSETSGRYTHPESPFAEFRRSSFASKIC